MKYLFRKTSGIYIVIIFVLFYSGCANIVAPTGGPRDEDPPVVLRSVPPNFSTRYEGQDVRIFFNEFVELRNLRQNLLVSPPLENDPEFRVRGRSIIMSVSDELLPNTTYNFFLGESIVDITEGNPIPNFQFVVSTGDYVDSLSVMGRLFNALTMKPEEGVFIMMYDNIYDSVPMLERPVYLTKTNKEGEFRINNMREGEYMMFALRDVNSNYKYDNPDEKIAFLDSLVTPTYLGERRAPVDIDTIPDNDTVRVTPDDLTLPVESETIAPETLSPTIERDTLAIETDTLLNDTISLVADTPPFYELFLFQEADTVQRIVSTSLVSRGKVNIVFRVPADKVDIVEYNDPFDRDWFIPEFSSKRDTLTLWMPDVQRDTLRLEISDRGHIVDSVTVSLIRRPARGRTAPAQPEEEVVPILNISTPGLLAGGRQPYFKPFELRSQTPLQSFNNDLFQLYLKDTIPIPSVFEFSDTVQRNLRMTSLLDPDSSYRLVVFPGAITDIFDATNDTLDFAFRLNNETAYATVILNLDLAEEEDNQYIIQLLDDRLERVIQEKIITTGGVFHFRHLPAATFRFRLIFDKNKNGRWDTGNYLRRQQPERVMIHPEPVQTRLNWEVEVIWSPL